MKVVIQRVSSASCTVDGKIISQINNGYMILVGFTDGDNQLMLNKMANKIAKLRVFEDDNGKMNLSIKDTGGEVLLISQFTLYADTTTGNRPSFTSAMKYDEATKYYDLFAEELNKLVPTKKGIFGADMKIALVNDGPVTIIISDKEI